MRLSEAWLAYLADKRLAGYSECTFEAYETQCRLLREHIGDVELGDITLEQLKQYLAAQTQLKASSLAHRVRFSRSFFRWAHEEGYVLKNPASKLREPKLPERIPRALSEDDVELLRLGCKTSLEHVLVEFIYSTGCRIGEVAQLTRKAIDWDTRSAIVRGKGDKEREVYFTVKAAFWLKKYFRERKDTHVAMFCTERKPYRATSIDQLRYILKRVASRTDIEARIYPHRLRHSFATHLMNNGAPLDGIQSLLGHSKIETTRLYAQLAGPRRRELHQKYFR